MKTTSSEVLQSNCSSKCLALNNTLTFFEKSIHKIDFELLRVKLKSKVPEGK